MLFIILALLKAHDLKEILGEIVSFSLALFAPSCQCSKQMCSNSVFVPCVLRCCTKEMEIVFPYRNINSGTISLSILCERKERIGQDVAFCKCFR